MEMQLKVFRWGTDLAIQIPKPIADEMHLHDGDVVTVRIEGETPAVGKQTKRKKWTEAELLEGVTPDRCGPEIIAGRVGKELL